MALHAFRSAATWEDLVTVFSRPSNLAKKLPPEAAGGRVWPSLFVVEAETVLYEAWSAAAGQVAGLAATGSYTEALAALAGLRPAVDRYFADVLVMADDEAVRHNRLRQLAAIAATVRTIAHLDVLQG